MDLALPRGERHICKTNGLADNLGQSSVIETQSVSGSAPKPDFEPLERSVYFGRERLGHYSRVGERLYAAYDADNRPLGEFEAIRAAYAAVARTGGA
ncbi:hypothetical protein [Bradyrhizobium barranii]